MNGSYGDHFDSSTLLLVKPSLSSVPLLLHTNEGLSLVYFHLTLIKTCGEFYVKDWTRGEFLA